MEQGYKKTKISSIRNKLEHTSDEISKAGREKISQNLHKRKIKLWEYDSKIMSEMLLLLASLRTARHSFGENMVKKSLTFLNVIT